MNKCEWQLANKVIRKFQYNQKNFTKIFILF